VIFQDDHDRKERNTHKKNRTADLEKS